MPVICAIDVGTNALRLVIGFLDGERKIHLVEESRAPVRLGEDVFSKGFITEPTRRRAVEALKNFRTLIDLHHVQKIRAVGTSALREAKNRDRFLRQIAAETGFRISVIEGEEEARLVYQAVERKINLKNRLAALIDVGGGSVEISLVSRGQIVAVESLNMGAVRLLQILEEKKRGEKIFHQMVQEYVESTLRFLNREIGRRKIQLCIGVGGNAETLGNLRARLFGKEGNGKVTAQELDSLIGRLRSFSYPERIHRFSLRPDRADVIVPASLMLREILKRTGLEELLLPRVGLKEGLLIELASETANHQPDLHRQQVLAYAKRFGRKFGFDEAHADTVARFAAQLFDQTRSLHRLNGESRMLLEVAAQLHDIGQYVQLAGHHRHSYYLLQSAPLIGLGEAQKAVVANVARYHRKSVPKPGHENYRALAPAQRRTVSKLAALLRLADALDVEHAGKVNRLTVKPVKKDFRIKLEGKGDLLLEKWALLKKADLFEKVFGLKVKV